MTDPYLRWPRSVKDSLRESDSPKRPFTDHRAGRNEAVAGGAE